MKINKFSKKDASQIEDNIALELPLEIRLGHNKKDYYTLSITMCSPDDIEDLVMGYLFTECIIKSKSEALDIHLYDNQLGLISEVLLSPQTAYKKYLNQRQGLVHASCGVCGKTQIDDLLNFSYKVLPKSQAIISEQVICSLPTKLNQVQQTFKLTGGVHACALFNSKGVLLLTREDIGRHNALDKLIGASVKLGHFPLSDKIILLSGRVSFELVHKSLIAGLTTLCAIGAPSSLSVEIAKLNNLKLYGFVKEQSYNLYS